MAPLDGVQLHRVASLDKALEFRRWAGERRDGPLFFDTESAGLNPYRDKQRLLQIGDKRQGWAFPMHWAGVGEEVLAAYDGELGAHNSPYDWRVLRIWSGMKPRWERTHDTLLGGHIMDSMRLAALKPRSVVEVDSRAIAGEKAMADGMKANGWTWATVPDDWDPFWTYGAVDTVLAAWLWDKWQPKLTGEFAASYDLERAVARICAGMMDAGMRIDVPFVNEKIAELTTWRARAMAWLREQHGITSTNSNEQVSRAMNRAGIPTLAWTDGGKPAIDKGSLAMYEAMFPEHAALIRTLRIARKSGDIVGKFLTKFLDLRDGDDTLRYAIHSCRARTSRMSITDPPMQTFDRDVEMIRGAFIPRPGCVLLSIDADQIEAREAAHFSGDERMIADFKHADENDLKFFIIMASRIYGTEITKKDPRYTWTKNATYAQIFGSGLDQAARTAGVPVEQMRPAYSGFRQLYPQVGVLMDRLIREGKAASRPQVRTWMNRVLYGQRGHEYALLNYKIQGSAAEIMKQGLVRVDAAGYGEFLRLPIHDEILMEVPADIAEEVLRDVSKILTDRESFRVPITWSGSILTDRWRKT